MMSQELGNNNREPPLTDEVKRKIKNHLRDMLAGDIFRALRFDGDPNDFLPNTELPEGKAVLAALLLCCCLIETAGRFRSGTEHGGAFTNFVNGCMNREAVKYDSEALYETFRCGLVHSLTAFSVTQNETGSRTRKTIMLTETLNLPSQNSNSGMQFQIEDSLPCLGGQVAMSALASSVEFLAPHPAAMQSTTFIQATTVSQQIHVQTFIYDFYQGLQYLLDYELEKSVAVQKKCAKAAREIGFLVVR